MADWIETTIGDQVTLQRGFDITRKDQRPGRFPVISSGGIASFHDEPRVKGPGVVLGRKGVVGSVYFHEEDFWPHDTTLWVRDFHGNNERFVYYFFIGFSQQLASLDVGSANPTLNRNHVHPIRVSWPTKDTQIRIAEILGSLDDKIELNRRMNATLEGMAQAIYRDWFVDFGPTRRKQAGVNDPVEIMGRLLPAPTRAQPLADLFPATFGDKGLPEGWEEEALFDQADWDNGAAYKKMHFSSDLDALPVIKIAELKAGITANTKFTNSELGERYRISNGELLFSWSGNPDTSIDAFLWMNGEAWLNQHIFAVRCNGMKSKNFLFAALKWLKPEFAEIARDKQTTGLGHVTKQDLKRLLICGANRTVLELFDEIVGPTFRLIGNNLLENQTLAAMRDLLLPKLMSGEIRVGEAERMMEDAA